jgi:Pyridoxamine 5'-phosphate oxidase
MKLAHDSALVRLAAHDHGILCTVHAERGVDAVPVVFALTPDGYIGIPVDLVKPKVSLRLQREQNLEGDPRATLLIDHWDAHDWTQLWWVRAELQWIPSPDPAGESGARGSVEAELGSLLADRYQQYQDKPFARILIFKLLSVTGWAGTE